MKRHLLMGIFTLIVTVAGPAFARVPVFPQRLLACPTVPAYSPAAHSFAAIRLALQDRRWTVTRQDQDAYQIVAQSCTRPPGGVVCAALTFGADASGQITVWLTDPNNTPSNVLDNLGRWMRSLDRSFHQYRCYTDELLQSLVLDLGIVVMPMPASLQSAPPMAVPTN